MYTAFVTRIKSLRKHTNADRLLVGECFGNTVIVSLDTQPDQLGVYFPTDGQLGVEYATKNDLLRRKDELGNSCGGYLDPEKRNIRALRLRGEQSDGLFMPLESLDGFFDYRLLKEGDTIDVLNGIVICEKYIPRSNGRTHNGCGPAKTKAEPKNKYPYFVEHIDTAQLQYNLSQFKPGDRVVLTLKMHGTSQRTANTVQEYKKPQNAIQRLIGRITKKPTPTERNWDCVSGTRRTVLTAKTIDDGGYYGDNAFRMKYHDIFKGKLQKGEEVFYEVVGYVNETTPIMSTCSNKKIGDKDFVKQYGDITTFSYGCSPGENDIYVYRMTMTNEDGYTVEYPWSLVKLRCEQMGIKHVPEFESFEFTTVDDLLARVDKCVGGVDPVGKTHVREGVVARIENKEKFTAYKHKNFEFKVLEGIIKENAEAPDMEEAQDFAESA